MRLAQLCHTFDELGFPAATSTARPPREHVRAIQHAVELAIGTDEFMADCIELELRRVDRQQLIAGLAPFHALPELGIRMALAYWRPGQGSGAHEHTDWTVTAVCHNALEVTTFDREAACRQGKLVPKNLFPAPAGRAGHIYDPCIHEPRNPTSSWSVSIHVLSPHDGEPAADGCRPEFLDDETGLVPGRIPHPFAFCAAACHRQRTLRVLGELLGKSRDARAAALLEGVFVRGTARTRRSAAAVSARRQPALAARITAACARHALTAHTRVVTRGIVPALEVRVAADGAAELLADTARGPFVLVRTDARAAPALRAMARERELVIGELPGDLADAERIALIDAVQDWGFYAQTGAISATFPEEVVS